MGAKCCVSGDAVWDVKVKAINLFGLALTSGLMGLLTGPHLPEENMELANDSLLSFFSSLFSCMHGKSSLLTRCRFLMSAP